LLLAFQISLGKNNRTLVLKIYQAVLSDLLSLKKGSAHALGVAFFITIDEQLQ